MSIRQDFNPNIDSFNQDVEANEGYRYTTHTTLSSQLATSRSMQIIEEAGNFTGRNLIDIGCGDGYFTFNYYDRTKPRSITAVDMADAAIRLADSRKDDRNITFETGDGHALPYPDNSFDIALIQSVLHHDSDPLRTIREAFRVAPEIVIHDPNGSNFGLKIMEKTLAYHREHDEKSYTLARMKSWITQAGGTVTHEKYAGFVPMFCPDWLARLMKSVEIVVESVPVIRALGCAVYVVRATRSKVSRV